MPHPDVHDNPALQVVTPEYEQAARLRAEVEAWLADSPNNPGWLESPLYKQYKAWFEIYGPQIEDIAHGITSLKYDHVATDLRRLAEMRASEKLSDGAFLAYEIAYAGIIDIVEASRNIPAENDHSDTANRRAAQAIGAILIRSYYWDKITETNEDTGKARAAPPFRRIFKQNILATIQRATYLEEVRKATATPQAQSVTNVDLPHAA